MNVFVAGASGALGANICRRLLADGHTVRALFRESSDSGKVQAMRTAGAEVAFGDLKEPASLKKACQGVDAVVSTVSSTLSRREGDTIESVDRNGQSSLVDAAKQAGVKHFVYISFSIERDSPLRDAKRAVEKRLKESGLTYTILRPTFYMDVWLTPPLGFDYPNAKATIYGDGTNPISFIASTDVAQFAVRALSSPAARNQTIELGGPSGVTPLEAVEHFERASGQQYELQHVPVEALEAQKSGATDPLAQTFATLMLAYAEGDTIPMDRTAAQFQVQLTSVAEYAATAVAGVKA